MTLVAAVTLVAAGCAEPSRGSATSAPPPDLSAALAGLCRAEDLARAGDLRNARATFEDQAHAYLHELAADAESRARAAVGRLLEAKNRVEAALRGEADQAPAEVGARLATLEAVTREVAAALGTPAPRCAEAGG
jgi:hypothetical protein